MTRILAIIVILLATASPSFGQQLFQIERLRAEAMRAYQKLANLQAVSPEVIDARRLAAEAYGHYYRVRTDVLSVIRSSSNHQSLRVQLLEAQMTLDQLYWELPRPTVKIEAQSRRILDIRSAISRLEQDHMDSSDDLAFARDALVLNYRSYVRVMEDSSNQIHFDSSLSDMLRRLRAARMALAGISQ